MRQGTRNNDCDPHITTAVFSLLWAYDINKHSAHNATIIVLQFRI